MTTERRTLRLRPKGDAAPDDPSAPIRAAIGRRLCIAATYNRTRMTIAPHILYTRHGDPFVDGVVIERDGKPPRELKLGTFKVAGLAGIALTPLPFTPHESFDRANPLYEGETLEIVVA